MKRNWILADDELVRAGIQNGKTYTAIAKELEQTGPCNKNMVASRVRKLGLIRNPTGPREQRAPRRY